MRTESKSKNKSRAVSKKGASGLCQIMPGFGGARLLAEYQQRFGSTQKALIAYNFGPSNVHKKLPRETRVFVQKVGEYHRQYKMRL